MLRCLLYLLGVECLWVSPVKAIWVMWWWIKHYQPDLTVLDKRIRQAHAGNPAVACRGWGGKISQTFPLHFALFMIFSANSFPVDLNRNSTIRGGNKNTTDTATVSAKTDQVLTREPQLQWAGVIGKVSQLQEPSLHNEQRCSADTVCTGLSKSKWRKSHPCQWSIPINR